MPFPPSAPQKIREKLDSGVLPSDPPERMYASYGSRNICDGCDNEIGRSQVDYEFQAAEARVFHLHLGCAGLWEAYRRTRGLSRAT